ncbi:MAG: anti-sigma-K factor RskA [Verrucomicrobiales bacterium]|jgi:anti-sigma-K factor RskA
MSGWGVALVAIVAVVGLFLKSNTTGSRLAVVESQLAAAAKNRTDLESTIAELQAQQLLDQVQIAGLQSQVDGQPGYFGFVIWDKEAGKGVLRVYNLPELDANEKDYQLWVVDPKYDVPVDGGVFQVGEDGAAEFRFDAKLPIDSAQAFAVSLEKRGGVPVAEGPMIVAGN